MKMLTDYDVLVNDTFYRSWHLFEYIEKHPDMSDLDKEAIKATIMDALVYSNAIDSEKDALDFENMCIVTSDDERYYHYESTPFVSGIPMELKEKLRYICVKHSGNMPVSLVYSKPAGVVSFCIYDMNEIFSVIYDKFSFVSVSYDSPTREGVRATNRPFLQVNINGEEYYIDALTKRIFMVSEFLKRYNGVIEQSICNLDFDDEMKEVYKDRSTPCCDFASYLHLAQFIYNEITFCCMSESYYEFQKTKQLYPEQWEEVSRIEEHIKSLDSIFRKGLFHKLVD